jgi:hypothetical protein
VKEGGVGYLLRKAAFYANYGAAPHSVGGGGTSAAETDDGSFARGGAGGWVGKDDGIAGGRVSGGGGEGSIIGTCTGTIVSEASDDDQSLDRTFWTTNDGGTPASARGLVAGTVAV